VPVLQATVAEWGHNPGRPELVIDGIPSLCWVAASFASEGGVIVQPLTGMVGPGKVVYVVCIHQEFAEAVRPILNHYHHVAEKGL